MKHTNIKKLEQANRPAFFNDAFRLAQKKVYFSPEVILFFLNANDNADHLSYKDSKRRYADYCDEVYTKVMGLALKMSIEGRAHLKRVRHLKQVVDRSYQFCSSLTLDHFLSWIPCSLV